MVRRTVRKIDGIDNVSVDLEKGLVEVICDSSEARRQPITDAIQKMGYKVVEADSSMIINPDSIHSAGH
jgi:copper chaperone CopZ